MLEAAKRVEAASYILTIDQGTTSTRAILFTRAGRIASKAQVAITQHYPQLAWVEHDAMEIWEKTVDVIRQALADVEASWDQIAAIAVTNQRETVVVWDKRTGQPVAPAIVWQCRRTEDRCQALIDAGHLDEIRRRTGLEVDAYFSATKLAWILDEVESVREAADAGHILAGTIDTWLIWKLTEGQVHVTDPSNAARSMLFNIYQKSWDPWLLELLDIPANILPRVVPSAAVHSHLTASELIDKKDPSYGHVPLAAIAGDQQAALFGQLCFEPGMIKTTYGTGGFILLQTGQTAMQSANHLITTIAWSLGPGIAKARGLTALASQNITNYALEGSVFNAGSTIQWLRDELGIIEQSSDCDRLAASVEDSGGVMIVPAFTGLGAPWWDMGARAAILGMTRASNKAHLCRAALESVALSTADVVLAMAADSQQPLRHMRVDGGVAVSDLMLQYQADILDVRIERPKITETTALGVAFLAGLAVGFWDDIGVLEACWETDRVFLPEKDAKWRSRQLDRWTQAVKSVRSFDARR